MSDESLKRWDEQVTATARAFPYPPTPDVAPAVSRRLARGTGRHTSRRPMGRMVGVVVLVLLALLAVGLLRSHAEILRRLDELSGEGTPHAVSAHAPAEGVPDHADVGDITGSTPWGEVLKIAVAPAAW